MNAEAIIKKWDNEKFPALREISQPKVDEYIEKLKGGTKFPEVLIGEWPKDDTYGEHAILDGRHRLSAYASEGGSVPYTIKKFGSVAEALAYAYTANMAHGLPVSEGKRNERMRLLAKMGWKVEQFIETFKLSRASVYAIISPDSKRGEKPGRKKGTKVSKSQAHKSLEPLGSKAFFKQLARIQETLETKTAFTELIAYLTPGEGDDVKLDKKTVKVVEDVIEGLELLCGKATEAVA